MLIAVLCVASLAGCKKPLLDYRKKYLGDFSFSIREESHIGGISTDTTYSNDGTISKGSDVQSIRITYSSGISEEFILFEDGSIRLFDSYSNSSTGEFESVNQMRYTFEWEHMVFWGIKSVTGIRK